MNIRGLLVLTFSLQWLQGLVYAGMKEVFNSELLAKVRAGEMFTVKNNITKDRTATNINLVWKATAPPTTKEYRYLSKAEILQELVFSFADKNFRCNWFQAMRLGWDSLVRELTATGPAPFMKKHTMDDKTFSGELGQERWKEVVKYFKEMNEEDKMYFVNKVAETMDEQSIKPQL